MILDYDYMDAVVMHSKISNSKIPSEIQGEKGSIIIDKINAFIDVKIIYNNGDIEDLTLPQVENDMYYELLEFINLVILANSQTEESVKYSSLNTLKNSLSLMEVIDDIRKYINWVYPSDMNS